MVDMAEAWPLARAAGDGARGRRCVAWGGLGAAIAAICCFTPILVVALTAAGLAAAVAWLDLVLLPLLAVCLVIMGVGLWKLRPVRSS